MFRMAAIRHPAPLRVRTNDVHIFRSSPPAAPAISYGPSAIATPSAGNRTDCTVMVRVPDADSDDLDIVLPAGIELLSPAPAATDVTSATEFSWSPTGDGAYMMLTGVPGGGIQIAVFTAEPGFVGLDTTAVGLELPADTDMYWGVLSATGVTVEDFAATGLTAPGDAVGLSLVEGSFRTAP